MTTRKKTDADFKEEIKANAGKVWMAGLGALATAEEEGGKLFRGLVKKGESYEKRGLAQFEKLKSKVEEAAEAARGRAGEAWEKVEETVEEAEGKWDDRVVGVLRKIGIPSKTEIAALTRRVEELTSLVEKKLKPSAPAKRSKPASARGAKGAKSRKSAAPRRKG
jgi:poly(hydroxyalkanoate) granule-associated protein